MSDSVLDELRPPKITIEENEEEAEVYVPRKCYLCKIAMVCSVVPNFIGMAKIGIITNVDECPYFSAKKEKK